MKKNGHHFYAQVILSEYLRGFLKERDEVRVGTDIESLHRMRVASRRLRSALRVFEDVFYPKKINKWRKRVRKIGRVLGAARELDIQIRFLELIKDRVRDEECRKGLDKFETTLRKQRHAIQKKIVSVLDSPATQEKISGLKSRLKDLLKKKKEGSWEVFRPKCEALVLRHLDDLLSYAPFVRQPEKVQELHQMRIAAKNLRYTLEILESFYGKGLKKFSRAAHSIQNVLGDLHEYDVWLSSLPCVASQHEDNQDIKKAVSYLEKKCAVLRAASYKKFVRIWEDLGKKKNMARIKEGDLKQSALVLAESCHYEKEHSSQVTRLSLSLFDQLASLHGLGRLERELLEASAILHDIGWMSGQKKHHKVALKIIVQPGKLPLEKQGRVIVGLVARYHRKSLPKMSHRFFSELDAPTRAKVKKLAALLRVADGLDRSHRSLVESLESRITPKQLILCAHSSEVLREDMEAGREKSDLLREVFKRRVRIVMERSGRPPRPRHPK